MNSRRGSTWSPISVVKISSAATASSILHLHQSPRLGIHRRFPELFRVHFAEALVALDRLALLGLRHEPIDSLREGSHVTTLLAALDIRAGTQKILELGADGDELPILGGTEEPGMQYLGARRAMVLTHDQQRRVHALAARLRT